VQPDLDGDPPETLAFAELIDPQTGQSSTVTYRRTVSERDTGPLWIYVPEET
jgi:hypothetical protein